MSFKSNVRQSFKRMLKDPSIKTIKIKYQGKHSSSQQDWHKIRNPVRTMFTALIFQILRKLPPLRIKNVIYRMFGMKIGRDVSIAYNVFPDPLFPELITIEDDVMMGSDCELATHEFLPNWFTLGRLTIKKNCMIGGFTFFRAGITVGKGAYTGMLTYVNKDVEANVFAAGIPAKLIKKLDPKELIPKKDIEITNYNK